jgi:tetratricopeptide (TPR) repeat protein
MMQEFDPMSAGPPVYQAFSPEGLALLNNKDYEKALRFYEPLVKDKPSSPEGWFGIGAIYAAKKDYKKSALCIRKVLELARAYPIVRELVKLDPMNSNSFFRLAVQLFNLQMYQESMDFCDEVMKCQVTPPRDYMKADALKRKARKRKEIKALQSNPALVKVARAEERQKVVLVVFIILLVAGTGAAVYFIYRHATVEFHFTEGFNAYVKGYRAYTASEEATQDSEGIEPTIPLKSAKSHFENCIALNKSYTAGHIMLAKTCNIIVTIENGKRRMKKSYDTSLSSQCMRIVSRELPIIKALDPQGRESANLKGRLDIVLSK